MLIPQFGFNDVVRPDRSYNRQISNIGYYWAPNDYVDLTGRLDWYSNRYLQYGVGGQYNWLNRFVSGSVAFSEQHAERGRIVHHAAGGITSRRSTCPPA